MHLCKRVDSLRVVFILFSDRFLLDDKLLYCTLERFFTCSTSICFVMFSLLLVYQPDTYILPDMADHPSHENGIYYLSYFI